MTGYKTIMSSGSGLLGQGETALFASGRHVWRAAWKGRPETEGAEVAVLTQYRLIVAAAERDTDNSEGGRRALWFNAAMLALLGEGGLLVHGAGCELAGDGWMLLGPPSAGKSTLSSLLETVFPGSVLSDERIGVSPSDSAWTMEGSPWSSDAGIARRRRIPLAGLVFLEKGTANTVSRLDIEGSLRRLLPLVSIPWTVGELVIAGTSALDGLLRQVPGAVFTFRKDRSAAEALAEWTATTRRE